MCSTALELPHGQRGGRHLWLRLWRVRQTDAATAAATEAVAARATNAAIDTQSATQLSEVCFFLTAHLLDLPPQSGAISGQPILGTYTAKIINEDV